MHYVVYCWEMTNWQTTTYRCTSLQTRHRALISSAQSLTDLQTTLQHDHETVSYNSSSANSSAEADGCHATLRNYSLHAEVPPDRAHTSSNADTTAANTFTCTRWHVESALLSASLTHINHVSLSLHYNNHCSRWTWNLANPGGPGLAKIITSISSQNLSIQKISSNFWDISCRQSKLWQVQFSNSRMWTTVQIDVTHTADFHGNAFTTNFL